MNSNKKNNLEKLIDKEISKIVEKWKSIFFFDSYPKNVDKKFHRTKFKEINIVMEIKEHEFVKLGVLPVFGFFILLTIQKQFFYTRKLIKRKHSWSL